jgi:hypothetical protein
LHLFWRKFCGRSLYIFRSSVLMHSTCWNPCHIYTWDVSRTIQSSDIAIDQPCLRVGIKHKSWITSLLLLKNNISSTYKSITKQIIIICFQHKTNKLLMPHSIVRNHIRTFLICKLMTL